MAHPLPGGGGGASGSKDVANVAKLALLGLGTLATGAFGMISLAAGYKVSHARSGCQRDARLIIRVVHAENAASSH